MKVEFKGGKELEAALFDLGDPAAARRTAMRALKRAAEPIRDNWAGGVDEQSGDLKRSIKIGRRSLGRGARRFRRGAGSDYVETFVGIDASEGADGQLPIYAYIEEFGRENQPANPAGRNAWEGQKLTAFNRLAADLRAEIMKTAKRLANKRARN